MGGLGGGGGGGGGLRARGAWLLAVVNGIFFPKKGKRKGIFN